MKEPTILDKMRTGIPGLDFVLEGGIVRGNSVLVEGPPGSGKTTLAIRTIYEGIVRFEEPAVVITFEEFPRQIYRESLAHGIDLEKLEKAGMLRVIWTPPSRILEGFTGENDLLDKVISEMGARRMVIDSITHFRRVAVSEPELREALAKMLSYLKIRGLNAILLKELQRLDSETIAFEEYLVDVSLRIYNVSPPHGGEKERFLEIRKSRGQGHISGRHTFSLSDSGLAVYPHLRPKDVQSNGDDERACRDERDARVQTGVSGLDSMLCGGFLRGSLNLVSGFSGTGKTVMALHFVDSGLNRGERCLFISTQRSADHPISLSSSLGMNWRPEIDERRMRILHLHPVGLSVNETMNIVLAQLESFKPERFVFDDLDGLSRAVNDQDRLRECTLVLATMLEASGTTSVVLQECSEMGGGSRRQSADYSYLASCVIQLSMAETESELRRFIAVRKHAGSDHAKELREVTIDASGMRVRQKPTGLKGILSGQTSGAAKNFAHEVIPSLEEITKVFHLLADRGDFSGELKELVTSASSKLGVVDILLREHFGITHFGEYVEDVTTAKREAELNR